MKRKWILIVSIVLTVGMLFSFSLVGCKTAATETAAATTAAATTAAAEKELVIGFIAINRQFEWLTYALKSAQEAADAAGVKMTVYDAENKAEKQGSLMEDLIAQKVDAIITDPISVESLNPFMVKAEAAGIPVVTVGDAKSPRNLHAAIKEGASFVLQLDPDTCVKNPNGALLDELPMDVKVQLGF